MCQEFERAERSDGDIERVVVWDSCLKTIGLDLMTNAQFFIVGDSEQLVWHPGPSAITAVSM